MNEDLFRLPTADSFALRGEQINVWRVNVAQSKSYVERYEQTLSLDEQERAARFRTCRDRERFIVARGALRAILSRYLDTAPQQLRFVYGEQGKPALESGLQKGVRFNVSHSESLALFAVASDCEVGIDIEAIRTDFDVEGIARRYFTPQESAIICAAPLDQRHEAFFTCWTLKEAYVKACGGTLSALFHQPEGLAGARSAAMIFEVAAERENTQRWWSHKLPTLPGYAAALVVEGKDREIRCWQWTEGLTE